MFLLFNILNPFKSLAQNFWMYTWYWDKKISTYKWFEIQIFVDINHLFEFEFDLRLRGRDHAGISIEFVIFCLALNLKIYDQRHWDHQINDWEKSMQGKDDENF